MKFKHADHGSTMRGATRRSFARTCCMIGCILIAVVSPFDIAFHVLLPGDANKDAGFSQATDSGSGRLTSNTKGLPTEAFIVSEDKSNPFLLLLAFRELTACTSTGLYPFYIADALASHSRQPAIRSTSVYSTFLLHSAPLRC